MSFLSSIVRDASPRSLQRQVEPAEPEAMTEDGIENETPEEQVQEKAVPDQLSRQVASVPLTSSDMDDEPAPPIATGEQVAQAPMAVARAEAEEEAEEDEDEPISRSPEEASEDVQRAIAPKVIARDPAQQSQPDSGLPEQLTAEEESVQAIRRSEAEPLEEESLQQKPISSSPHAIARAAQEEMPADDEPLQRSALGSADLGTDLGADLGAGDMETLVEPTIAKKGCPGGCDEPQETVQAKATPSMPPVSPGRKPVSVAKGAEVSHTNAQSSAVNVRLKTAEKSVPKAVVSETNANTGPEAKPSVAVTSEMSNEPAQTPHVETGVREYRLEGRPVPTTPFPSEAQQQAQSSTSPKSETGAEPRVHIGQVDVIITQPASANQATGRTSAPSASSMASKRYLRRL